MWPDKGPSPCTQETDVRSISSSTLAWTKYYDSVSQKQKRNVSMPIPASIKAGQVLGLWKEK